MMLWIHVFKNALGRSLVAVSVVLAVAAIIGFFDTASIVTRGTGTALQAAAFYLYQVPRQLHMVLPIGVMLGVVSSLGSMVRAREMLAARSLGAGRMLLLSPVLAVGLIVGVVDAVNSELLVPFADKEADRLRVEVFKAFTWNWTMYYGGRRWLKAPGLFVHVEHSASSGRSLLQPVVFGYGPDFRMKERYKASSLKYENGKWIGRNVLSIRYSRTLEVKREKFETRFLDTGAEPGDFEVIRGRPYQLRFAELEQCIHDARKQGRSSADYEVELNSRVSFPLMMLVAVLFGFWASAHAAGSGGIVGAAARGVAAAFLAWMLWALFVKLGMSGAVVPAVGAWGPVLILLVVSSILAARTDFTRR